MKNILLKSSAIMLLAGIATTSSANEWSGIYVGGGMGVGFDGGYETTIGGVVTSDDLDTMTGSMHLGFDYQSDKAVLGSRFAFNLGTVEDSNETIDMLGFDFNLRGGYVVDGFLPYITAGYSAMALDDGNDKGLYNGLNFGAGLEYMYNDHIVLGVEALSRNVELSNGTSGSQSLDLSTVAVTLSYKF